MDKYTLEERLVPENGAKPVIVNGSVLVHVAMWASVAVFACLRLCLFVWMVRLC